MVLVAIVAFALIGLRLWDEGLDTHWTLLKLRFGDIKTRRTVAKSLHDDMAGTMFADLFGGMLGSNATPAERERAWKRRQRRAEMLLPTLIHATRHPDAELRKHAIDAVGVLIGWYQTRDFAEQARASLIAATTDPNPQIRAVALGTMGSLARNGVDRTLLMNILAKALEDHDVDVRLEASKEILFMGTAFADSLPEAARLLVDVVEHSAAARERARAVAWLGIIEKRRRDQASPTNMEVLGPLSRALEDRDPEVRRAAARVLSCRFYSRKKNVALWLPRKTEVEHVLKAARLDVDETVRLYAGLGLFEFGLRDRSIIADLERGASNREIKYWRDFKDARDRWHIKCASSVVP